MSTPEPARRPRGDAARNRDQLLRAAGALIAVRGTSLPLDQVARSAGLSSGTLYRNFSSRRDLMCALFDVLHDELDVVVDRIEAAPSGWQAILAYVDGVLAITAEHPEISQVMAYMREHDPGYRAGSAHWDRVGEQTAARARAEGSIRADAAATDLAYLPHLLVPLMRWPEPQRGYLLARMRALLLDGLRGSDQREPMPTDPLSVTELRALAFSLPAPPG